VYEWTGPRPTKFNEAPELAALVKAGKLPPVDQRLPIADHVRVVGPPDGIGNYGGTYRVSESSPYLGEAALQDWNKRDSDGFSWLPNVGFWELNDLGTVYTMKLRKGLKFSDGDPLTIDDVKFAFEDLTFNKELNPSLPGSMKDLVTGNVVKFNVVDDWTWTLTFDSPQFTLMENREGRRNHDCGSCWFASKEYYEQYHPKYADASELQKKVDDGQFENWVGLFTSRNQGNWSAGFPCVAAWCLTGVNPGITQSWTRNAYYFGVDPAGNQLPYADNMLAFGMESREVAVFRAMAGETDAVTRPFQLREMPLYLQNADRGDFRVFVWPSTGGNDAGLHTNSTFNDDPEIGKWIRTKKFRQALSLATDRDMINDVIFLGQGKVQQWVPHPDTAYYPGADVGAIRTTLDIAGANSLLDEIGLSAKNADGFRLRTDNGKVLELELLTTAMEDSDIAILLQDQWAKVGIKIKPHVRSDSWRPMRDDSGYMALSMDMSAYQADPWMVDWTRLSPVTKNSQIAAAIGLYRETQGAKGMAPGSNSAYLPIAPASNYAADPTGSLMKLQDLWLEGRKLPRLDPARIEKGKEIFRINVEEQYHIGIVGFTGSRRGIMINRNNFRNVPITHIRDKYGFQTETYYFTNDGKGNYTGAIP